MAVRGFRLSSQIRFPEPRGCRLLTECGAALALEQGGAALREDNPLTVPGLLLEDGGLILTETGNRALQEG